MVQELRNVPLDGDKNIKTLPWRHSVTVKVERMQSGRSTIHQLLVPPV